MLEHLLWTLAPLRALRRGVVQHGSVALDPTAQDLQVVLLALPVSIFFNPFLRAWLLVLEADLATLDLERRSRVQVGVGLTCSWEVGLSQVQGELRLPELRASNTRGALGFGR